MSLIKPRTRGKHFAHVRVRLEQQNYETWQAYATFLGEDLEYVVNEVIDQVLAKDKTFVAWRLEHQPTSVPPARPVRTQDRAPRPDPRQPAATDAVVSATPNLRR